MLAANSDLGGNSAGRWSILQVAAIKPHTAGALDWRKLRGLQHKDGDLKLSHFRRVKQLGSGDVGLVDLVQIQARLPRRPPPARRRTVHASRTSPSHASALSQCRSSRPVSPLLGGLPCEFRSICCGCIGPLLLSGCHLQRPTLALYHASSRGCVIKHHFNTPSVPASPFLLCSKHSSRIDALPLVRPAGGESRVMRSRGMP